MTSDDTMDEEGGGDNDEQASAAATADAWKSGNLCFASKPEAPGGWGHASIAHAAS